MTSNVPARGLEEELSRLRAETPDFSGFWSSPHDKRNHPARLRPAQQSMSELVDGLERLGYVEWRPDARDRRAKIIGFTERSQECIRLGIATVDELERGWSRRIGDQEATAMRAGLERIALDDTGP